MVNRVTSLPFARSQQSIISIDGFFQWGHFNYLPRHGFWKYYLEQLWVAGSPAMTFQRDRIVPDFGSEIRPITEMLAEPSNDFAIPQPKPQYVIIAVELASIIVPPITIMIFFNVGKDQFEH